MAVDKKFLNFLEEKMKFLAIKLRDNADIARKGFTVNSGAWANNNGFCVAYISCARSPNEETIDLTIDVSFKENVLSLETGIYLSDGSLIQDLGSVKLVGESLDETKSGLEKYFNQIGINEFVKFSDFLLQ